MLKLSDKNLNSKFIEHNRWLKSLGKEGMRLNLDNVDLTKNDINKYSFEQSYVIGCVFEGMGIQNQSFYLSKLYSSSFKNGNLQKTDFTRADLSYADFSNVYLCNVNFNRCECIETDFSNSKCKTIKLTGVTFDMVDLRNTTIFDVDVSYSCFEKILVKGIFLKNIRGIENICNLSINIESIENPKILCGKEAIKWLEDRVIA